MTAAELKPDYAQSGEVTEAHYEAYAETEEFKREAYELLWDLWHLTPIKRVIRANDCLDKIDEKFELWLRR